MRFHLITLNCFAQIPVTRYIIEAFKKHGAVEIVECTIKDQYEFRSISRYRSIGQFADSKSLNNQTRAFKIRKYGIVLREILRIILRRKGIVYSPDYQVIYFLLKILKVLPLDSIKIIYHQFELIDKTKLPARDLRLWDYILQNHRRIQCVIFPELNRMRYFQDQTGIDPVKLILFRNTCRPSYISAGNEPTPNLLSIPASHRVVGHVGNLGPDHYLDRFFELIEFSRGKNISFIVVGHHSPDVRARLMTLTNPNVFILEEVPHSRLATIYPQIDIGFILYKGIDLNFEYCAPNKLYEYWSYGIPVIAHHLEGLLPVFVNPKQGKLLNFESPDFLAEAMESVEAADLDRQNLAQFFSENLSIEKDLSAFEKMVAQLN